MPRDRKTQSGAPALAIASTPGVRYGEGQNLQQLQQRMPTPDNQQVAADATAPQPATMSPGQQMALPPEAAMLPIPKPGLLLAPTTRPNEPVTAGLRTGPGPGPSQLDPALTESPTGKLMRELSRITGRQGFADLARRSGL